MKWLLTTSPVHSLRSRPPSRPSPWLFPFPESNPPTRPLAPSPSPTYISTTSPSYTRGLPPCSEPLTTHLRLLRTTTSSDHCDPFCLTFIVFISLHSLSPPTPKFVWLSRVIPLPLRGLPVVAYWALLKSPLLEKK